MRSIDFGGRVHEFPADATDDEVAGALDSWDIEQQALNPSEDNEMPNAGWDANNYVEMLALAEGTKAHKSIEGGVDTRAYGVKFVPPGVDGKLKGKPLAVAVASWHKDQTQKKLTAQGVRLDGLGQGMQTMLVDLHYNAGSLFNTTPKKLALDDKHGAILNTLEIIGATENGKSVTYGGLATRRARFANLALAELGLPTIAKVEVIQLDPVKTGGTRTQYNYLDANGAVIHTTRTSRALSQTKLDTAGRKIAAVPTFGDDIQTA